MHVLFLLIFLQTQPIPNISTPREPSISRPPTEQRVQLPPPTKSTTPNLTIESDLMTHYEIGVDVGAQREAVGELRSRVFTLEDKRDKTDRPDIDSLKSSRIYAGFVITAITTALLILGSFKKIIWNDVIKPRLKKELV